MSGAVPDDLSLRFNHLQFAPPDGALWDWFPKEEGTDDAALGAALGFLTVFEDDASVFSLALWTLGPALDVPSNYTPPGSTLPSDDLVLNEATQQQIARASYVPRHVYQAPPRADTFLPLAPANPPAMFKARNREEPATINPLQLWAPSRGLPADPTTSLVLLAGSAVLSTSVLGSLLRRGSAFYMVDELLAAINDYVRLHPDRTPPPVSLAEFPTPVGLSRSPDRVVRLDHGNKRRKLMLLLHRASATNLRRGSVASVHVHHEDEALPLLPGGSDVLAHAVHAKHLPDPLEAAGDEKPFPCSDCTKVFKRMEHLKRHIRLVHSLVRPFPCKYCDKKFSRSDNLAQHLKTHKKEKRDDVLVDFD